MMNSLFSPQPARRQQPPPNIQRPVASLGVNYQVPVGSSTSQGTGAYSAFAPYEETAASLGARRWDRARQHRSLDGDALTALAEQGLYAGDPMPPADPQVPVQSSLPYHLSHSPRFLSQGNLTVGGSSSGQNMQMSLSSNGGGGPFSNALLSGLSSMNLESMQQKQYQNQQQQQQPSSFMSQSSTAMNNYSATSDSFLLNPTVTGRDPYSMSLPVLQREYEMLRREYETATQKLNSTMNSIKTFWSPELKKERAMRKDESAKFVYLQEKLKMASIENQKQVSLINQLQDELHCQYEMSRTIRNNEVQSVPREEYDAVRLERDRLHRELTMSKDTLREQEVQIDTQRQTLVSRDESIKKLLDMLQSKGLIPYGAAQEHLELENAKSRIIELDKRCMHLESAVHQKNQDVRILQEECLNASERLKQIQTQSDRFHRLPMEVRESGALHALMETKVARIEQLEQRIALYEDEINRLRDNRLQTTRNLTDFTFSEQQLNELKNNMEKSDLELKQKLSEIQAMQTRLSTSEEQTSDFKKHLELVKQSVATKEQQISNMQTDMDSLRSKLDGRMEVIEQKTREIQHLHVERTRLQAEIIDLNEQLKIKDGRIASLNRKLDNIEDVIKEKDRQHEMLKQRLTASPAAIQQKQIQDQLDEIMKERDRMMQQIREQRDRIESERMEELDVHRREVRDFRLAIESLQKEIADRQILIESQNEKISDVNREVTTLKTENKLLANRGGEMLEAANEIERLNKELTETRNEVERLLKIVQALEKEKESINLQIRELEKQMEEAKLKFGGLQQTSSLERKRMADSVEEANKLTHDFKNVLQEKDSRVEELEEALKESVSITAERELLIAQQKQQSQIMDAKLNAYKDQLAKNQKQIDELQTKLTVVQQENQDKDAVTKSLKHERRKHLEEVLQLKEEALLAAISEKDAHIALLETSPNRNPEEVETLRKHKEKLMKRLKEENARRVKLLTEQKDGDMLTPLVNEMKSSPNEQIIQVIRYIELQKKKMRVFIDQLLACILDIDPELLIGLPRTQQSQGVDVKLLKKLTHDQLLIELQQRENDSLLLQHYANSLLQRLSRVKPSVVQRALKLLDSLDNDNLFQSSEQKTLLSGGRSAALTFYGQATSTTVVSTSAMHVLSNQGFPNVVSSSNLLKTSAFQPGSLKTSAFAPASSHARFSPTRGIEC